MTCPSNLLGPYLDNELNEKEKAQLELHLAHCTSCQREILELQRLFNILEPGELPELGAEILSDVMGVINKAPSPLEMELIRRKRVARFLGWSVFLSAFFSMFLLLKLFWNDIDTLFWNSVIWTVSQIIWLSDSFPSLADIVTASIDKGKTIGIVVEAIRDNSYSWAALLAVGVILIMMLKDIIADVHNILSRDR